MFNSKFVPTRSLLHSLSTSMFAQPLRTKPKAIQRRATLMPPELVLFPKYLYSIHDTRYTNTAKRLLLNVKSLQSEMSNPTVSCERRTDFPPTRISHELPVTFRLSRRLSSPVVELQTSSLNCISSLTTHTLSHIQAQPCPPLPFAALVSRETFSTSTANASVLPD